MIDRYLLRYLLAVIDNGTFTKAAAQCNVSQPTLSAGIAKLERIVGRPVFHRSNRRIELTEAGVRLADHARRIEAEFALAEQIARETTATETFRLGIVSTLPTAMTEDFLRTIRKTGAGPRLEIVQARERELLDHIGRRRIDAALTLVRDDSRFRAMPLFTEGYGLALAADHPLAGESELAPERLGNEAMIARRHCEALPDTSRFFTRHGVRPFFSAKTTNEDWTLALVRRGAGITVMPDCHRAEGVARAALAGFDARRTIGILFPAELDTDAAPAAAVFGALAETIRPPDDWAAA